MSAASIMRAAPSPVLEQAINQSLSRTVGGTLSDEGAGLGLEHPPAQLALQAWSDALKNENGHVGAKRLLWFMPPFTWPEFGSHKPPGRASSESNSSSVEPC